MIRVSEPLPRSRCLWPLLHHSDRPHILLSVWGSPLRPPCFPILCECPIEAFLTCYLWQFPRAAVKSHYKHGSLTTAIYSHTVLGTRSPKTRCKQDWVPLDVPREPVPCLSPRFWWLLAILVFLGLWQHNCNLCLFLHMGSSPGVSMSLLLL